ncbi:class I SAM-dependent methyltransferase [Candidatus Pelagibacter bacterium nBUS_30]|uniref:class I SAM-dependent methyltransferase n=1 Tax=unclassified Candidatus Pelagibacter TaxID=2647897 RepID=UPI003EBE5B77
MVSLKNWDNKTWLSSKDYIKSFSKFLIKNSNLNSKSEILDIGCGRGKISGNLYNELKLTSKPTGIDIVDHKDKDKRIKFKKSNGLNFLDKNKKFFDLILIKQTIHLLKIREIKKLIKLCKKYLKPNGVIMVLTLDPYKNEIPTFKLMNSKLKKSLNRDKKIIALLKKNNKISKTKRFIYKVKILKSKYLQMINDRYISILLEFDLNQIKKGVNEINSNFKKKIIFNDKLQCIIIFRNV